MKKKFVISPVTNANCSEIFFLFLIKTCLNNILSPAITLNTKTFKKSKTNNNATSCCFILLYITSMKLIKGNKREKKLIN